MDTTSETLAPLTPAQQYMNESMGAWATAQHEYVGVLTDSIRTGFELYKKQPGEELSKHLTFLFKELRNVSPAQTHTLAKELGLFATLDNPYMALPVGGDRDDD